MLIGQRLPYEVVPSLPRLRGWQEKQQPETLSQLRAVVEEHWQYL